jgi:hypothetical protein
MGHNVVSCLAGYSKKVKGRTAEERLDMRAAMKSGELQEKWAVWLWLPRFG